MTDQGKPKKKKVERAAREHFYLVNKLYHWDLLPSGKRQSHRGLGKQCPLFIGHLKENK